MIRQFGIRQQRRHRPSLLSAHAPRVQRVEVMDPDHRVGHCVVVARRVLPTAREECHLARTDVDALIIIADHQPLHSTMIHYCPAPASCRSVIPPVSSRTMCA